MKGAAAIAAKFRPEYLDFDKGIHVGNLEECERITRILKLALEARYAQPFVTERWGRGVYWQWIGFLAKANRAAKPLSSDVSFGCSKFYITVDRETRVFQCGLQIERGYVKATRDSQQFRLREDWDWNRFVAALKPGSAAEKKLVTLLEDGFLLHAGAWGGDSFDYSAADYPGARALRKKLETAAPDHWAGVQVYFPMSEAEVKEASGLDLVESMIAVFEEVTPLMNVAMQVELEVGPRPLFVEPK